jgi:hypothetical protein
VASSKIVAADEARGGRLKKETRLRRDIDYRPLATRCYPICARHPYLPKGAKGPGPMLNHRVGQLTTQRPSEGA